MSNKNTISHGIVFKSIKLKNFMSFSNLTTEINLDYTGTTLIIGENLDNGGSSGAGKSTLINAISYCLYDKIPSNVSKDKLINRTNDKKITTMEVELHFSKGQDNYSIRRWRGSSNGVELLSITEDKSIDITPASVSRGEDSFNNKIEELLGFSYNLFSQIILFNGNSVPFLDLSVGSQRSLIEELFRITMLSKKSVALKKIISDTEKNIGLQRLLIEQQKKQNVIHNNHLIEAKNRVDNWDSSRTIELDNIQKQLESSISFDFETEESLLNESTTLSNEINKVKSEIKELNLLEDSKINKIKSEIKELNLLEDAENNLNSSKNKSQIREIETKKLSLIKESYPRSTELSLATNNLNKLSKDLSNNEKELLHLNEAKCPYCLQDFLESKQKSKDIEIKIETIKNDIISSNNQIDQFKQEMFLFEENKSKSLKLLNDDLDFYNLEAAKPSVKSEDSINRYVSINKLKDEEILNRNRLSEMVSILNNEVLSKQTQLSEIVAILTYTDLSSLFKAKNDIKMLENRLESMISETNPHSDALKTLISEGEIPVDLDDLAFLEKNQEHQQFLLKLLTDKNSFIRKNIISKTIPFLNKRISYYTNLLNLHHLVTFQSDMSCEISEFGRELDHGNLSNGEKKKLNLSLCLSFRDVLTYLHSKVNVLFTDEIDGGSLSGGDIESLMTMLKTKAWEDVINIFIVSHRPEFEGQCDKNIIIRKEKGFSSLIIQPD